MYSCVAAGLLAPSFTTCVLYEEGVVILSFYFHTQRGLVLMRVFPQWRIKP